MKTISLFAALLLLTAFALPASATETISLIVEPIQPMINLITGVIYTQVPDRGYPNKPLQMDITVPHDREKHPAIVYVNGGGFINANKDRYIQHRTYLSEHGYVVASITYRVAPTSVFPAALEDVKSAVRFLRAHAERFGIDPERIGIIGGSAGGYLAALAGATNGMTQFDKGDWLEFSSDVQAVVDLYGITDLNTIASDYSEDVQQLHRSAGATQALWVNGTPVFGGRDGGIAANPEGAAAASPLTYISDRTPPFLLMHGDADTLVSPSQTEILRQALEAHGIEATRYLIKDAPHGGPYWVQPKVIGIIGDFFDKHLKK